MCIIHHHVIVLQNSLSEKVDTTCNDSDLYFALFLLLCDSNGRKCNDNNTYFVMIITN